MKREGLDELKKLVENFEKEVSNMKKSFDKRDGIKFNQAKTNAIKIQQQIHEAT